MRRPQESCTYGSCLVRLFWQKKLGSGRSAFLRGVPTSQCVEEQARRTAADTNKCTKKKYKTIVFLILDYAHQILHYTVSHRTGQGTYFTTPIAARPIFCLIVAANVWWVAWPHEAAMNPQSAARNSLLRCFCWCLLCVVLIHLQRLSQPKAEVAVTERAVAVIEQVSQCGTRCAVGDKHRTFHLRRILGRKHDLAEGRPCIFGGSSLRRGFKAQRCSQDRVAVHHQPRESILEPEWWTYRALSGLFTVTELQSELWRSFVLDLGVSAEGGVVVTGDLLPFPFFDASGASPLASGLPKRRRPAADGRSKSGDSFDCPRSVPSTSKMSALGILPQSASHPGSGPLCFLHWIATARGGSSNGSAAEAPCSKLSGIWIFVSSSTTSQLPSRLEKLDRADLAASYSRLQVPPAMRRRRSSERRVRLRQSTACQVGPPSPEACKMRSRHNSDTASSMSLGKTLMSSTWRSIDAQ
eukprot:scaffold731_cov261-Pinguiococcus_pyrenoidosus.AAC.90